MFGAASPDSAITNLQLPTAPRNVAIEHTTLQLNIATSLRLTVLAPGFNSPRLRAFTSWFSRSFPRVRIRRSFLHIPRHQSPAPNACDRRRYTSTFRICWVSGHSKWASGRSKLTALHPSATAISRTVTTTRRPTRATTTAMTPSFLPHSTHHGNLHHLTTPTPTTSSQDLSHPTGHLPRHIARLNRGHG